jgi:hypothetical protein
MERGSRTTGRRRRRYGTMATKRNPATTPAKPTSKRLTSAERALFDAVLAAPEPERFDLLMASDRDLVQSLVAKGKIEFPKVRRLRRKLPGATITREQARKAILAIIKQERAEATAKNAK